MQKRYHKNTLHMPFSKNPKAYPRIIETINDLMREEQPTITLLLPAFSAQQLRMQSYGYTRALEKFAETKRRNGELVEYKEYTEMANAARKYICQILIDETPVNPKKGDDRPAKIVFTNKDTIDWAQSAMQQLTEQKQETHTDLDALEQELLKGGKRKTQPTNEILDDFLSGDETLWETAKEKPNDQTNNSNDSTSTATDSSNSSEKLSNSS